MGSDDIPLPCLTLRNLPIVARVVISVFLIAVGIGYFSALVQLHFQQASAGQLLPGPDELKPTYHGHPGMGEFERLIVADETKPFNGSGSMRSAFTFRSSGWVRKVREVGEKELRKERDYEINALLAWLHDGAKEASYREQPLAPEFFKDLPQGADPDSTFFEKKGDRWVAKVNEIIDTRCVRCHAPGKGGAAGQIQLESWKNVMDYVTTDPDAPPAAMSLAKLAQTTHAHLLSFAMLWGLLTGLIFAFTSYSLLVRAIIAPLALVAQVAEISCWWLSRVDPIFVYGIVVLGGLVAVTLAVHIFLSLFDMYDKKGKVVVTLLVVLAGLGGGLLHTLVVGPHLAAQRAAVGR